MTFGTTPRGLMGETGGLRFTTGGLKFGTGGFRFTTGGLKFGTGGLNPPEIGPVPLPPMDRGGTNRGWI
jgi:hypothetical protein